MKKHWRETYRIYVFFQTFLYRSVLISRQNLTHLHVLPPAVKKITFVRNSLKFLFMIQGRSINMLHFVCAVDLGRRKSNKAFFVEEYCGTKDNHPTKVKIVVYMVS